MNNAALTWLHERPWRMALVALLLLSSVTLIYSNRTKKITQLKQRITQQQAQLTWMRHAESILSQNNFASPEQARRSNTSTNKILSSSFSEWLPDTKYTQFREKDHLLIIQLESVATEPLLNWLSELDHSHHIRPTSLSIIALDKANTVKVKLRFPT